MTILEQTLLVRLIDLERRVEAAHAALDRLDLDQIRQVAEAHNWTRATFAPMEVAA